METGKEIVEKLRAQLSHYAAMKLAVDNQTAFIQAKDIDGLASGASEVRGLMRKIRDLEASLRPLRQSWNSRAVDRGSGEQQEVESLISSIRESIVGIQEVRVRNETMLKAALGDVRAEMNGLKSRSHAAKAYQNPARRPQARFVDKSN